MVRRSVNDSDGLVCVNMFCLLEEESFICFSNHLTSPNHLKEILQPSWNKSMPYVFVCFCCGGKAMKPGHEVAKQPTPRLHKNTPSFCRGFCTTWLMFCVSVPWLHLVWSKFCQFSVVEINPENGNSHVMMPPKIRDPSLIRPELDAGCTWLLGPSVGRFVKPGEALIYRSNYTEGLVYVFVCASFHHVYSCILFLKEIHPM